ncbi:MAG: CoA activase [Oligoflexia bacterium]|nr:CoA activase [Oligoflexia bacterium]
MISKIDKRRVMAVDIGPISVSLVVTDLKGALLQSFYEFHHGKAHECFSEMVSKVALEDVRFVVASEVTPKQYKFHRRYHNQLAVIRACKFFHPEARSLLVVGGERFSLITFDEKGEYKESRNNTSCAAGTGSFLDQQAKRLGLASSAELSERALAARGEIPAMASRCAVFAKTDLLHAQQEGYSSEAISMGLCQGLAKSIADTLFKDGAPVLPLVMAGGVALNQAVRKSLEDSLFCQMVVDEYAPYYSALGVALLFCDEVASSKDLDLKLQESSVTSMLEMERGERSFYYSPLSLSLSSYPSFNDHQSYLYKCEQVPWDLKVEVDLYESKDAGNSAHQYILGVDIGSTSTKALLIDRKQGKPAIGVYTRTSGRPLLAMQALLEALYSWNSKIEIMGVATTGAGRKFIGKLTGANLIIDEITAHARAAYELNPAIDTIFEIGGQDAKFTNIRNGVVTFSVMNNVCAAGTGSFIEEQAQKLGVTAEEFSLRCEGMAAPLASDCCTVFMERDINHYLSEGHTVPEILATILHSVRENYLRKVVQNGKIGSVICFQGATAKNRALVAAFEQKLQRPIFVSPFCHLTGALGAALLLLEQQNFKCFNGSDFYRQTIEVRSAVCNLCINHCKLRMAHVGGEEVVYGLLCGRDADSKNQSKNESKSKNLVEIRREIFTAPSSTPSLIAVAGPSEKNGHITIGIPGALYLFEELPFWKSFFRQLGFKVVSSENYKDAISHGKKIAKAEFCSPIATFHGHVAWLSEHADYVFMPTYLEAREDELEAGGGKRSAQSKPRRRQYCYYGQYASALVSTIEKSEVAAKCLSPVLKKDMESNSLNLKLQLVQMLSKIPNAKVSFLEVYTAYDKSVRLFEEKNQLLQEHFKENFSAKFKANPSTPQVVFLGRPYTILSRVMNKNIPEIFARMGIESYFQDMLSYSEEELQEILSLIRAEHWHYANKMLEVALICAKTQGLYPVLVTSFKCAPDSCTLEYFRRIMDSYDKPYLIIQLDEHNSSVGYETRIESALHSFRNHLRQERAEARLESCLQQKLPVNPIISEEVIKGKTLLIPIWDPIVTPLTVANLRAMGIDARILEEDENTILRSLQLNTGQCLPLSVITQGVIDYVLKHNLDPEKTMMWILQSQMACNVGAYPYFMKSTFEAYGRGMEKITVYSGDVSFIDLSLRTAVHNYFAVLFGGLLRKLVCQIRPYEINEGESELALKNSILILEEAFLGKISKMSAVKMVVKLFQSVKVRKVVKGEERPKVAIIGDFYVRDNDVMNQDLIRFIEKNGGEVVSQPFTDYMKIVAKFYFKKWVREGKVLSMMTSKSILATIKLVERQYLQQFATILGPKILIDPSAGETKMDLFNDLNLNEYHNGETFDNILNIVHILKSDPDVTMFVQTNPAYCCPSLITEALSKKIEKSIGMPVVTYDGTLGNKNELILPYLKFGRSNSYSLANSSAWKKS